MPRGNLPEVVLLALGAHGLDIRAVRELVVGTETPKSRKIMKVQQFKVLPWAKVESFSLLSAVCTPVPTLTTVMALVVGRRSGSRI